MSSLDAVAPLTSGSTNVSTYARSSSTAPSRLRNAILACAAGVARCDGLYAVDISSVAHSVGISAKRALSHFPSTSNLIDALWDEMIEGLELSSSGDDYPVAITAPDLRLTVTFREPTIAEMVRDPLINLMNEADCINERQFAQLLESAARVLPKQRQRTEETVPQTPVNAALSARQDTYV